MELKKEQKRLGKIVTLIDFVEETGQWRALCGDPGCPNTGEFARSDGSSPIEHDMVWMTAVQHEKLFHDGDGLVDVDELISVRPYPVPNPNHGAASRA